MERDIKRRSVSLQVGEAQHVLSSSPLEHAQARDGFMDSEGIFVKVGKAGERVGRSGLFPRSPGKGGKGKMCVQATRRVLLLQPGLRTPNPVCPAGVNRPTSPAGGAGYSTGLDLRRPGEEHAGVCISPGLPGSAHARPQTPFPGSTGEKKIPNNVTWGALAE